VGVVSEVTDKINGAAAHLRLGREWERKETLGGIDDVRDGSIRDAMARNYMVPCDMVECRPSVH